MIIATGQEQCDMKRGWSQAWDISRGRAVTLSGGWWGVCLVRLGSSALNMRRMKVVVNKA